MDPTVVAAWIAAGVSVLTLAGTLAAQYYGYRASSRDAEKTAEKAGEAAEKTAEEQREQLDRTLAEQRDRLDKTLKAQNDQLDRNLAEQRDQLDRTLAEQRTRTLNERFATAAEQMGDDKPPTVRLAGVYAMAGLADDWDFSKGNQQTCVDVLCGYLRMPYEPEPDQDAPEPRRLAFQSSQKVRHTVIRVITAHLQGGAAVSWRGLDFDFTGVVFDGGDFRSAQFSGGKVNFSGARFSAGLVDFDRAKFTGSRVYFNHARFSGGLVSFLGAKFSGGMVDFSNARFSARKVYFSTAEFSGGTVRFNMAEFSGGTVDFSMAEFSGTGVYFNMAEFAGGTVDFAGARFSGGQVSFVLARFSGGTVDFSNAINWWFPPEFSWTDTPPAGLKLPQNLDQPKA
jgi:uncharacterized protein YjbI with pentapeptide repeats